METPLPDKIEGIFQTGRGIPLAVREVSISRMVSSFAFVEGPGGTALRKMQEVNQVLVMEIFQHIREGLGTDPVQPLLDIIEADLLVMANDADDQDRPFLRNKVDDAFEGTQADMITFFFHSRFISINWT
jgi:hypothetical protein